VIIRKTTEEERENYRNIIYNQLDNIIISATIDQMVDLFGEIDMIKSESFTPWFWLISANGWIVSIRPINDDIPIMICEEWRCRSSYTGIVLLQKYLIKKNIKDSDRKPDYVEISYLSNCS